MVGLGYLHMHEILALRGQRVVHGPSVLANDVLVLSAPEQQYRAPQFRGPPEQPGIARIGRNPAAVIRDRASQRQRKPREKRRPASHAVPDRRDETFLPNLPTQ